MLKSFIVMDLPLDATDEEVRARYLELIRVYSPEKEPEAFREITAAYEAVKEKRERVKARLTPVYWKPENGLEEVLHHLVAAARFKKRKAGLKELIKAAGGIQ